MSYVNPENRYDRIHDDEVMHWYIHGTRMTHQTRVEAGKFNPPWGWEIGEIIPGKTCDVILPYSGRIRTYYWQAD